MEFTLLWAALTAAAMMSAGTRIWPNRLPNRAFDRLIGAAAVGLFSGRIVAMGLQGINPITNPTDIIIVRGGVDTAGAVFGALLALIWSVRHELDSLDSLAPAAMLGLAGWHAGCLWRGACLGAATDLPWGWSGPTSDITRHPVELYAALGLVAAAYLIGRTGWRPFLRFGLALGAAGLIRLVTEPLRPSLTGGPTGWYTAAIALGLVIAALGSRLADSHPPPTST